jgi:hypothetical protein
LKAAATRLGFDVGTIRINHQLQRVRGELFLAPVKTQAGRRGLPLLDVAAQGTGRAWGLSNRKKAWTRYLPGENPAGRNRPSLGIPLRWR